MFRTQFTLVTVALIFSWFVAPLQDAHATSFYTEFGANLGSTKTPALASPLFIPLTFGVQLQDMGDFPQLQLGLQARYKMASPGFTAVPTYPVIRMEFWRLVIGAGYAPYVWNNYDFRKSIGKSLLLEASFLFPITPEIDFGLNYGQQKLALTSGSKMGTSEYGIFFRLNFGMSSEDVSAKRKFKGWRYPFGNFRN